MIDKKTVSQCLSSDYFAGWNDAVDAMPRWISVEERLPDNDVPVVHARWIEHVHRDEFGDCIYIDYECSGCHVTEHFEDDGVRAFCPNCGAKMDGHITNPPAKPENCRYYTENSFWGGGCLGTKEIDACHGENCGRWKPKMDGGAEA